MESIQQYCSRVRENLNIIFTQLLREYERALACLKPDETSVIEQWLQKLRNSNRCIKEMTIRNEIMAYLVNCARNGNFDAEPFKNLPPSRAPLEELIWLLPPDYKSRCTKGLDSNDPRVALKDLPECGKFILEQPIPRHGAFSVLYLRPTKFT